MNHMCGRMRWRGAAVALVGAALGLAACGQQPVGGQAAPGDVDAYCEAMLGFETLPGPDIDFETASPDAIMQANRDYAEREMTPLIERVAAAAPAEIAGDIAVITGAVDMVAETGDDAAFYVAPDVATARQRAVEFAAGQCGWATVDVTGVDYGFDGVPETLEAGAARFAFSNEGGEDHEMVLFRKNEGVTEPITDLLALPEEEAFTKVTFVGVVPPLPPGQAGNAVAQLEPGSYAMLCALPVGGGEDGPPHFTQGMVHEFTVA